MATEGAREREAAATRAHSEAAAALERELGTARERLASVSAELEQVRRSPHSMRTYWGASFSLRWPRIFRRKAQRLDPLFFAVAVRREVGTVMCPGFACGPYNAWGASVCLGSRVWLV